MLKVQSAVALYSFASLAEDAMRVLQEFGTDFRTVSIAAVHESLSSDKKQQEETRYYGEQGEVWGGPWALLHDSALFNVAGLGPVRLAGPIIFWMEAVLRRAVAYQGVTALGAGLVSIGVSVQTVRKYEHALRAHQLLLIVHGDKAIAIAAKNVMVATWPASLLIHGHETMTLSPLHRVF